MSVFQLGKLDSEGVVLGEQFPALVACVTEVDVTLVLAELVEEDVFAVEVEHWVVLAGGGWLAFDVSTIAFLPDVDPEGLVVPSARDLEVEACVIDAYELDEVELVVHVDLFLSWWWCWRRAPRPSFSCCKRPSPVKSGAGPGFQLGKLGVVLVADAGHFGFCDWVAVQGLVDGDDEGFVGDGGSVERHVGHVASFADDGPDGEGDFDDTVGLVAFEDLRDFGHGGGLQRGWWSRGRSAPGFVLLRGRPRR